MINRVGNSINVVHKVTNRNLTKITNKVIKVGVTAMVTVTIASLIKVMVIMAATNNRGNATRGSLNKDNTTAAHLVNWAIVYDCFGARLTSPQASFPSSLAYRRFRELWYDASTSDSPAAAVSATLSPHGFDGPRKVKRP